MYIPALRHAFCFRIRITFGKRESDEPIDALETEAAALGEAIFGPLPQRMSINAGACFVDNNVSLAWLTAGTCRCPELLGMLAALWLSIASRRGFVWWERVASDSNPADRPSRGDLPLCLCGWRLFEVARPSRWSTAEENGERRGEPELFEVQPTVP